ncbi:hypothetical protein O1M63_38110 [Streptomyces mirabilis]|nr:hypothetical protein [Streptomyces mirabilis]
MPSPRRPRSSRCPPAPRPARTGPSFGARALARLAAGRAQSTGGITPKVTAQDSGGGNEAGEIAEGADQYAEARTSPGVVAPGPTAPPGAA